MTEINYAAIELLVLDVDGVLTDGRIILTPSGEEIKAFCAKDGAGIKYFKRAGRKVAIISGRGSPAIRLRAKELGIDTVHLNAKDKLPVYEEILQKTGATAEQTAVIGDDLTDLPLLMRCGLAVAVNDAVEEVKQAAVYVTKAPGGAGAVREVVELILKSARLWDRILARYTTGCE